MPERKIKLDESPELSRKRQKVEEKMEGNVSMKSSFVV